MHAMHCHGQVEAKCGCQMPRVQWPDSCSCQDVRSLVPIGLVLAITACSSGGGASTDFPVSAYATVTSSTGDVHYEMRTAPTQPPARGLVSLLLTVTDSSGAPVDGLTLDVVPWMPAMGHGASIVPSVVAQGHGDYLVNDLVLVMPGTWELRLSTGTAAVTVLPITVQ